MKATNVLKRTLEAEKNNKIIVHEGGSRSSKTWSIFQFFILKALAGEELRITIARSKLTWLKDTILQDLKQIVKRYNLPLTPDIKETRQNQTYTLNGTEFVFVGLDQDPQKEHGRSQDWFWFNEAMEISKSTFDQIEMRTDIGGIIDYNPSTDDHWVFDIQKRPDVVQIHSTMLDNPFLPETIISKIRSYEPTPENVKQGTADKYMWEVYGLGQRARLEGLVFNNWDLVDEVPSEARSIGYGLDFGYTNDPTALVEVFLLDGEVYINEVLYTAGMNNQDIVNRMELLGVPKSADIFADSAEPKSIEEIKRGGFRGIKPVEKGRDSVNFGIDIMKSRQIYVTEKSVNLEKELRRYKWAEDKDGNTLNKPIDDYNHAIDATRYLCMSKLSSKPKPKVYSKKPSVFQ